ncbi:MAG: hypothetical protein NT105_01620 [Verrucomicrobia bacterium]|nr:hypothetical protein [Verrucomicrobiota bacterium]
MKRFALLLVVALVSLLVGFGVGWTTTQLHSAVQLQRVVAMSWGDGWGGLAFYGAHVFLEPQAGGYSVRARVYIGRNDGCFTYFHDCGELGRVQTDTEAVARWGRIEWREDGLHIGAGTNHFFLPRARLERHR